MKGWISVLPVNIASTKIFQTGILSLYYLVYMAITVLQIDNTLLLFQLKLYYGNLFIMRCAIKKASALPFFFADKIVTQQFLFPVL